MFRLARRSRTAAYSCWLVETLVHIREISGVERLHTDENPFAPRRGNQIDKLFIAQKIGADLRDPGQLSFSGNDVSEQ